MRVSASEIKPGLALFLDPDILLKCGAMSSVDSVHNTIGRHLFLCVSRKPRMSLWIVLNSRKSGKRIEIGPQGREGSPGWKSRTHYFHPDQIWAASPESVMAAAYSEKSLPELRNTIDPARVPSWW